MLAIDSTAIALRSTFKDGRLLAASILVLDTAPDYFVGVVIAA